MKLTQNEYMTLDLWLTSLNDRLNDELSETGRTDVTDVTQDRYSLLKKLAKAASNAAPAVPEGCVLVPEEPTEEMRLAGKHALKGAADLLYESEQALCVYRAMIDAAPAQEGEKK